METYRGFIIDDWQHISVCRNSCNGKVIVGNDIEEAKKKIDDYFEIGNVGYEV